MYLKFAYFAAAAVFILGTYSALLERQDAAIEEAFAKMDPRVQREWKLMKQAEKVSADR